MRRDLTTFACWCCATLFAVAAGAQSTPQHTVSIDADGRDELRIGGGNLVVRHFSWQLPTDLVVDGVARPLTWNGNESAPVVVPIAGDYWVRKSSGRDGGYAVQRQDGFALAAIDNLNGNDVYTFELHGAPGANTTDWMRVRGGGATPGLMDFAGTSGYVPRPAGEATTFSLNLDGSDELMFVNGNLVVRHLSWQQPASITINGVSHPLTFNNNLSQPIPLALPDRFEFVQTGGRTILYPVETPVGLMIGAADELLGPDVYTWTLVAVPEPASMLLIAAGITVLLRPRRSSTGPLPG